MHTSPVAQQQLMKHLKESQSKIRKKTRMASQTGNAFNQGTHVCTYTQTDGHKKYIMPQAHV